MAIIIFPIIDITLIAVPIIILLLAPKGRLVVVPRFVYPFQPLRKRGWVG
jgi:hypothetical protein